MLEHVAEQNKNVDYFLIIDDSYEGMLTQSHIENIKKIKNYKDILILSSNEKLQGSNVLNFSYHIYNDEYDNIEVKNHKTKFSWKMRNKKFICLNRQERLHRLLTVDFMIEKNIIADSYVSCQLHDFLLPLKNIDPIQQQGNKEKVHDNIEDFYSKRKYSGFDEIKDFTPTNEQRQRLLDNLPLTVDGDYETLNPFNLPSSEQFFSDSYWAIITERDFFKSDIYQGWTEKILKCFLYMNPFVVVGLPGTLESLHKYGFLTFSNYIDESYDSIEDDTERMKAVFKEIEKLNSLNLNQLDLMYKDMQLILEHNRKRYIELNQTIPTELLSRIQSWCKYHHV